MVQNIDAAVFQRMMIHAHAAINAQKQPIKIGRASRRERV